LVPDQIFLYNQVYKMEIIEHILKYRLLFVAKMIDPEIYFLLFFSETGKLLILKENISVASFTILNYCTKA
jgi:hypothetical protein